MDHSWWGWIWLLELPGHVTPDIADDFDDEQSEESDSSTALKAKEVQDPAGALAGL
jgi:hypothetical protein